VINNGVRRQAIAHLEDDSARLGPDRPDRYKRRSESSGEQAGRSQVAEAAAILAESGASACVDVVK
jgi:hypothetical protein